MRYHLVFITQNYANCFLIWLFYCSQCITFSLVWLIIIVVVIIIHIHTLLSLKDQENKSKFLSAKLLQGRQSSHTIELCYISEGENICISFYKQKSNSQRKSESTANILRVSLLHCYKLVDFKSNKTILLFPPRLTCFSAIAFLL